MKKFLITILVALLIGGGLGLYAYKKMNNTSKTMTTYSENKAYAIQVGVFTSYDNASLLANKYNGIIVPDESKYRVYLAIVSKSNILNLIKNYYDQKGISYYVKEIVPSDNFLNSLSNYEELFAATTSENYQGIIDNILKEYQKELI